MWGYSRADQLRREYYSGYYPGLEADGSWVPVDERRLPGCYEKFNSITDLVSQINSTKKINTVFTALGLGTLLLPMGDKAMGGIFIGLGFFGSFMVLELRRKLERRETELASLGNDAVKSRITEIRVVEGSNF